MTTLSAFPGPVLTMAPGATTTINYGFNGTIDYAGGLLDITGLVDSYGGTDIKTWDTGAGQFEMWTRGGRVVDFGLYDTTGTYGPFQVYQFGNGVFAGKGQPLPDGAKPLSGSGYASPLPAVSILDTTTGAAVPDTFSTAYTGPVAGIAKQMIDISTDSLNITANAPSMFIKTGAGNDAVVLKGGTNVVDAGGGSNFLTASGGGADTFFLDGRNIPQAASAAGPVPGALWDTIEGFVKGDAVTIWGLDSSSSSGHLWQANEGAAGHKGITLHTLEPSGAMVSLTLVGLPDSSHLGQSFGSVNGNSYMYIKAM